MRARSRIVTMSPRGRVTIPKEIRDAVGFGAGDKIDFVVEASTATLRRLPTADQHTTMVSSPDRSLQEVKGIVPEEAVEGDAEASISVKR